MPGRRALFLTISLLFAATTCAQEIFRAPIMDRPLGTPGLGAAIYYGNDAYTGEPTSTDRVPLMLYEGKRVFAYGNSLGLNFLRNDTIRFGALVRARLTGVDPREIPELEGLDARKNTAEAGLMAGLDTPFGQLSLTGVRDVAGRYDGNEVDLSYRLPVRLDRWTLTPWISVLWQDDRLTGYYYGVSEKESRPGRPAYTPGAARNIAIGLNTAYHWKERVFLFANFGVERFDDEIADSPIVDSSSNLRTFAGASWVFGGESPPPRSKRQNNTGPPLWSWRVHWAYQIRHNIVPLPASGIVIPSRRTPDIVPTQLGLTLSRKIRTGERADLFARASVFRHLEEPYQGNFNSYTLAMAGVVKSFDNFTDKIKFRWGIGFGLSYAEVLPAEEIEGLVNRGKEASRLLLYLELTFDYALDRLIRWKSLENCFVGAVITHRSGVWGGSELLGGVSGGSDWAGLQLECLR